MCVLVRSRDHAKGKGQPPTLMTERNEKNYKIKWNNQGAKIKDFRIPRSRRFRDVGVRTRCVFQSKLLIERSKFRSQVARQG